MKRSVLLAVPFGLLVLSPVVASAQQAPLNDQQKRGQQVLAQSCGVCHLPVALNARTYGPPLNKTAANGDDDIMREYITNGTPRMPAFKHYLQPSEIDAIIAYVRTVPVQAPPTGPAPRGGAE